MRRRCVGLCLQLANNDFQFDDDTPGRRTRIGKQPNFPLAKADLIGARCPAGAHIRIRVQTHKLQAFDATRIFRPFGPAAELGKRQRPGTWREDQNEGMNADCLQERYGSKWLV